MNTTKPEDTLRLIKFEVKGLFGEHDYDIPLNVDEHVTAIIAPNGTGKTLCLRLISAFFKRKWGLILDVDFEQLNYHFSNGNSVTIDKNHMDEDNSNGEEQSHSLIVKVHSSGNPKTIKWTPKMTMGMGMGTGKRLIESFLPFMTRVGDNNWRHDRTRKLYDLPHLAEEFGEYLPEHLKLDIWGEVPEKLMELTNKIDCRLIETQRLLVITGDFEQHMYSHRSENRSTLAIMEKAETLKNIISQEINAYAARSQSLDRSFPHRVISNKTHEASEGLQEKLSELDQKRTELMQAGILDKEKDDSMPSPTLADETDDEVVRVLQTYAVDTQEKLDTLEPLLKKINLFKELIAQRFRKKDVQVDRERGIFVKTPSGEISLDKLSSGEQHQLVLFFELLFEIKGNSLILIDEPELSLHVAWQKKFVRDLLNIIALNKFDVILATHSPQLISHWGGLVVELGDGFEAPETDADQS